MPVQDLNDLYFFAQVVEHGGFAAASRATGVPKSRLSRRIAQLEDSLGVRLIHRSTRRFAVTDVGRTVYAHGRAMAAEAEAATEAVERTRAEPQGVVRASCPILLAQGPIAPMVSAFLAAHPRVSVELEVTNRRVDVIAEGFDLALRVRQPPLEDSELVIKLLGHDAGVLVGSPACLDRLGRPRAPAELAGLASVDLTRPGDEHQWRLTGPDGQMETVRHAPRLVTDEMQTLRRAVLDGIGVAMLPRLLVASDLETGGLEQLLPDWTTPSGLVHAVFPSRRGLVPAVRLFLDALPAAFSRCGLDPS
jgi:DNA-binding transcriptional LysR family regulator